MEDDLYDEFGNYIGEEVSEEEEDAGYQAADAYLQDDEPEDAEPEQALMEVDDGPSNAVILHEDKQYYPTAQQVYGRDVETMVQEEDAQALSQPIVAPVMVKKFSVEETDLPETYYSREFMADLMNFPEKIRNISLAGHLHHGKTALMDMLVLETHKIRDKLDKKRGKSREDQLRYTDTHNLERERGLSLKASPMMYVRRDAIPRTFHDDLVAALASSSVRHQ
jgi:116 kDa U5 small nuclear ribonucleoprotein component